MSNDPSWGTVKEAAQRTGLNAMTIRRYIDSGILPARRVGVKLIRVNMADVDALIRPHEGTTDAPETDK